MTTTPHPLDDSEADSSDSSPVYHPKQRPHTLQHTNNPRSPLASLASLPYRRSNTSLSNLFASTTSVPTSAANNSDSGVVTPPTSATANGSVFSPTGSTVRSPSPVLSTRLSPGGDEVRDVHMTMLHAVDLSREFGKLVMLSQEVTRRY